MSAIERITSVEFPEGSVLVGEIAVISYLDEEGVEHWSVGMGQTMIQSHIVGLLAMVQHALIDQ